MMPNKTVLLAEVVGGVNAAVDSGIVDTLDFDYLTYSYTASAPIVASSLTIEGWMDAGATKRVFFRGGGFNAGTTQAEAGIGPGASHQSANGGTAVAQAVPARVRASATAGGAGVAITVRIYGKRSHRGPDVSLNPD